MKALTILQPWASLIIWGEKNFETRGWRTSYRGLLAIHAAKKDFTRQIEKADDIYFPFFRNAIARHAPDGILPTGVMLGIVEVLDVIATCTLTNTISPKERVFGDWGLGRYAWHIDVKEVFEKPIPCSGHQGLWNWERM